MAGGGGGGGGGAGGVGGGGGGGGLLAWFWNERFWLPHNVTWADLKSTEEAAFPQVEDLYLAFPLALALFMLRMGFESIQMRRGLGLSKQLGLGCSQYSALVRQETQSRKPSTLRRFCESSWRFTFYLYIFTYGSRLLKKSPWLWNTRQCWIGYPSQPLMPEIHYYYIVELSYYWSVMFSQFIDIKRKDFGIMFTHHIVTVILLTISYTVNFTRVGTLTICLHDAVDVVLEAAKMANYCKFQRLCDFLFLMFAIIFIITRLGIYPLWILNTTMFELPEIVGGFPALSIFIILLLILQVLHCFWSYLIVKAAYKAISKGKAGKWNPLHARDDRSDVESSSDEEPSAPHSKNSHNSTTTNGTSGTNGTNGYLISGSSAEEH
ncbi:ceramide synthase 6 [Sceloporus undulatus]|uniref:ceramide synthase 6 n=1 Tax=Sceloporus undulatus TaxID=8520 RepID=UPI001C4D9A6E|nr:ceramide synthase 6 [Sceloporus undulatus]